MSCRGWPSSCPQRRGRVRGAQDLLPVVGNAAGEAVDHGEPAADGALRDPGWRQQGTGHGKTAVPPWRRRPVSASAAAQAQPRAAGLRVSGDLYEVASTPEWTRVIIGDAEGKGLPGVQMAAATLGAFREAVFDEDCLARIAARIETSLVRQVGGEQFVTAMLAQVTSATGTLELISCGHPPPLLLGAGGPREAGPVPPGLPLGLGGLAAQPREPVTMPFAAGDAVLFFTDGITEARDPAREVLPARQPRGPLRPARPPGRRGPDRRCRLPPRGPSPRGRPRSPARLPSASHGHRHHASTARSTSPTAPRCRLRLGHTTVPEGQLTADTGWVTTSGN